MAAARACGFQSSRRIRAFDLTGLVRWPLQVLPEDAIISEGDGHFKEQQLATQTEAVGIIHPPPDIRSIVVRTLPSRYGPHMPSVHISSPSWVGGGAVVALTAPLTALTHSY